MPDKNRLPQSRRDEYADAAIRAFGRRGGYNGTTLNDIAVEAEVTQPRISQVYGNKLEAFLEAHARARLQVIEHVRRAATEEFDAFDADVVEANYLPMLRAELGDALMVMHYANAAAHVPEIGAVAREMLSTLWRLMVDELGWPVRVAREAVAWGAMMQVTMAISLPDHLDEYPELAVLLRPEDDLAGATDRGV